MVLRHRQRKIKQTGRADPEYSQIRGDRSRAEGRWPRPPHRPALASVKQGEGVTALRDIIHRPNSDTFSPPRWDRRYAPFPVLRLPLPPSDGFWPARPHQKPLGLRLGPRAASLDLLPDYGWLRAANHASRSLETAEHPSDC